MALRSMRVGVPLSQLRSELMAETFQSMTPAQTTSSTPFYNYQLARVQREQWDLVVWPHLTLYKDVPMVQGQRFYPYPTELPHDSVTRIWGPVGSDWVVLSYGITPATYSAYGGENNQGSPPQRWAARAGYASGVTTFNTFEIWPNPNATPVSVRVEGQAPLNALTVDTDTCVIDATLLVLMAAAEILSVQKSEGAAIKLQKANAYRRMLVARLGAQQRSMRSLSRDGGHMGALGGTRQPTPYIDYIPATS
jgi:hypothetical protein